MKYKLLTCLVLVALIGSCSMRSPDERAIFEMLKTFISAVEKDDESMAKACLMDLDTFNELNPDVVARVDSESFIATTLAELIHHYRDMADFFGGRTLKLESMRLGSIWYQYKGRQAFKDTEIVISADDESVPIIIKGIVRIHDKWQIVDLSGNDMF